ncbi:hypothetical protein [Planomonospora sp. ID82291]|uniref:hypothetical protein n=1 Tax=Planomonospora sp. ID82291 TaxID=2738136 RepID=UPI0018C39BA7|nr:hypothetical protein [Planomonospora sp. ID82291]MBG0818302.1 hypothetical protein [Planomonospora sp. ID82291]
MLDEGEFAYRLGTAKDHLEGLDVTDAEWALVEGILRGEQAEVFLRLLCKVREAGDLDATCGKIFGG